MTKCALREPSTNRVFLSSFTTQLIFVRENAKFVMLVFMIRKKKQLFAITPENLSKQSKILKYNLKKEINYPNTKAAFYIIEPSSPAYEN